MNPLRTRSFLFFVALLAGCRMPDSGRASGAFGPGVVTFEWNNGPVTIVNQNAVETINGVAYQVYRDNTGNVWLREPNPPHNLLRRDQLPRPQGPGLMPIPGMGLVNERRTSRPIHHDFSGQTVAGLCARVGLDQVTGRRGVRESIRGLLVASFDWHTLLTHVVYPMRQDLGLPDVNAHPNVRYDIQLLAGATPTEGFLSLAIEGDLRDVARYLMAQGVERIDGIPIDGVDTGHTASATIDRATRTVSLWFNSQLLRSVVIP